MDSGNEKSKYFDLALLVVSEEIPKLYTRISATFVPYIGDSEKLDEKNAIEVVGDWFADEQYDSGHNIFAVIEPWNIRDLIKQAIPTERIGNDKMKGELRVDGKTFSTEMEYASIDYTDTMLEKTVNAIRKRAENNILIKEKVVLGQVKQFIPYALSLPQYTVLIFL